MTGSSSTVRIVLCMIVRNEARILQRCLDAALPLIDAACICDTGSTDDTPAIAEQALARAGKPLRLCSHEWVNFGVNRSRSFSETRAFAEELGWELERSYALFLDADMVLHLTPSFAREALTADAFRIRQGNDAFQYDNLRLAKLALPWRSVGATHEYWSATGSARSIRLDTAWIQDIGDGGSKADKTERDIRLLEADLDAEPDNPRTVFYLAQSYFDSHRYADARALYERRAGMDGWEEEGWYAAFRAGLCALELAEWDRAVAGLLNAWQRRPSRAEPLYQLARAARIRGASQIAMLAAERALSIPFPEQDTLFLDGAAYDRGPTEEISISAYYTGEHDRGAAACDALLRSRNVPSHTQDQAASNLTYYTRPIASADARRTEIPYQISAPNYAPANSSICRTDEGYVVLNRLVNYHQHGATVYISRDPDGKYRTRNAWLTLDRQLSTASAAVVDDSIVDERVTVPQADAFVVGIEDIRLIQWRGEWWFSGGSSQFDPYHLPRVVIGRIDPNGPRIDHLVPLEFAGRQPVEKNWVPFIHDGRLLLLYSSDPTLVLEPDPENGQCRVVHQAPATVDLSLFRGSSQLIPVGGRYLYTIHEVAIVGGHRVYLHRFVEMDSSFVITRVSRAFNLTQVGVEYTCGMCLSHDEQSVILSCNWEERESWLVPVPRSAVDAMLLPIDELATIRAERVTLPHFIGGIAQPGG
ncbi:MAG TPA: hypothetical protein DCX80_05200 [Chloroflexi bacterium]|nr:hypothetical protein [Chloroflexota bacterium]